MLQDRIVETCPELFIEIVRFIPDIQGIDIVNLMLVNKKWFDLIENDSDQILYKLLCQDRLPKDYFNNNNVKENYKNLFIQNVLNFWSEYLQTYLPFKQLPEENNDANVLYNCKGRNCYLTYSKENESNYVSSMYRHIRSKYPITRDTTMYFYVKHLEQQVDHSGTAYLLIGIINEYICNGIVGKQYNASYNGHIETYHLKNEKQAEKNLIFNTSYASNGYISCTEGDTRVSTAYKFNWKKGDFISIKVSGICEKKICISYYLNDELMHEINNVLVKKDVLRDKHCRLYFCADINQDDINIDNTVFVASYNRPTVDDLADEIMNKQN